MCIVDIASLKIDDIDFFKQAYKRNESKRHFETSMYSKS